MSDREKTEKEKTNKEKKVALQKIEKKKDSCVMNDIDKEKAIYIYAASVAMEKK
jgi:hypothetical protein